MKNVTFSMQDHLLQAARKKAASEHTTLNSLVQQWLLQYVSRQQAVEKLEDIWEKTSYFRTDRKYSREEMNER